MNDKQKWLLSLVIMAVAEFHGKLSTIRQADKITLEEMDFLFESLRQIKTHLGFLEKSSV